MMVFPGMLTGFAKKAGMSVPDDPDQFDTEENKKKHPHFFAFCIMQLCRPMTWDEPEHNAAVIAKIPVEKLTEMTVQDFVEAGVWVK